MNYKYYCWSCYEYGIEETLDGANGYDVFGTFREAKQKLVLDIKRRKQEYDFALKTVKKSNKSDLISSR